MKKIRVGIIGFGLSGRYFHVPFLKAHDGFEIISICSSRSSEIKALFDHVKIYSDPYQLFNHDDLDLIINCSPNTHHFSLTSASLKAGKHVVVEKPFVNSVEEGEELIRLAKENGKILTVFQNRRWDGDFLTIAELIKTKRLGKIKQFESHFDRFRPLVRAERWREVAGKGAGTFFDLGSHLLDQAFVLFGKPNSISVDLEKQRKDSPVDDYFHVILKYGEMRVILHSSSYAAHSPRFQVHGEKGSYIKFGMDPQEEQLKAGLLPDDPQFGLERGELFGKLILPEEKAEILVPTLRGAYSEFYSKLFNSISSGEVVPVTPESALEVMRVISEI